MQTITIPLDKNPTVADLVADKEPGEKIYGRFSIKAVDQQTLTLTTEQMSDSKDDLDSGESEGEDDSEDEVGEDEEPVPTEVPKKKESMGAKMAARLMETDSAMGF